MLGGAQHAGGQRPGTQRPAAGCEREGGRAGGAPRSPPCACSPGPPSPWRSAPPPGTGTPHHPARLQAGTGGGVWGKGGSTAAGAVHGHVLELARRGTEVVAVGRAPPHPREHAASVVACGCSSPSQQPPLALGQSAQRLPARPATFQLLQLLVLALGQVLLAGHVAQHVQGDALIRRLGAPLVLGALLLRRRGSGRGGGVGCSMSCSRAWAAMVPHCKLCQGDGCAHAAFFQRVAACCMHHS